MGLLPTAGALTPSRQGGLGMGGVSRSSVDTNCLAWWAARPAPYTSGTQRLAHVCYIESARDIG